MYTSYPITPKTIDHNLGQINISTDRTAVKVGVLRQSSINSEIILHTPCARDNRTKALAKE
jgi:hypothetical protein